MARRWGNAYHDWYIGGVLQARMHTRPVAEGYPRTHVKRIAGWRSSPDADDVQAERPAGRRGTIPYPRTTRDKAITYELRIEALTEADLITAEENLSAAFADVSSTGLLVVTPWPLHATDVWATYARVDDFDSDGQFVYQPSDRVSPWKTDPILVMRSLDGRWIYYNESGTSGTAMTWTGNPNVSVTNSGKAPAEPIVQVASVASGADVHIGRDLAGGGTVGLWFRALPAGTLTVDFPNHKASVGGTDVTDSYDATSSEWWDEFVDGVPPGSHNLWRGPGAGGAITVSMFSASW